VGIAVVHGSRAYWCQPRNAREQKIYQLTAWARRLAIQNHGTSADYDWHIELTASPTIPVKNNSIVIFCKSMERTGIEPATSWLQTKT